MKKIRFFAALCCAAMVFAACDKSDEPKNDSNNNQNKETTDIENNNDPKNDTKEAVDLGLSVKWATCNVGATSPEKYGNYYAWGEIAPKSVYTWEFYKYTSGKYNTTLTKYNNSKTYGATVDSLTTLEASDDAATQNWGGSWRMPTSAEWEELIEKCTWTWTTLKGVNGYEVKAVNGNSIFLPAAGIYIGEKLSDAGNYGDYWSSSLIEAVPDGAWSVCFYANSVDGRANSISQRTVQRLVVFYSNTVSGYANARYGGQSVRPVCE